MQLRSTRAGVAHSSLAFSSHRKLSILRGKSQGSQPYSERTVLDLVGLIYDAADDAARWPAFLERLGQALRTTTNNLFLQDVRGGVGIHLGTVGMEPVYFRSYLEHYGPKNIHLIRGARIFRQGQVYRSEELCPDDEAAKTEFWNEWIVPQKMSHALFGVLFQGPPTAGLINVVRRQGTELFAEHDLALLRSLLPHLQRAVQLHRRITDLEIHKKATSDALNRWSVGVILVNEHGDILLMNQSAEAIVNQKDGLSVDAHGLRAARPQETVALRNLIHGATRTSFGHGLSQPGGAMVLPRPSLNRPLNVLVTPVCANGSLFPETGAAAAIFVSDPEAEEQTSEELLRQFYGLSRAEACVAALLVQGKTVKEICEGLSISLNTAKTHVKAIFEKTGTKRQVGLVKLALHNPIFLRLASSATRR